MNFFENSKQHLYSFLNKIIMNEPFAIVRPADGEFQILCNQTLTNCDNWTFQSGGRLRQDMIQSLTKPLSNLYIGIPCDECNREMKTTYVSLLSIPKERLTYANVFCNANWKTFIGFLRSYQKGFSVVTSGTNETDLPINDRYIIDPYLVNCWEKEYEKETHELLQWISTKTNELICFSAGPLSKVWIPIALELFPTNIYLDVGSSLDLFTKGSTNRYYTKEGDGLESLVCRFQD